MRQFVLPEAISKTGSIKIKGPDSKYILKVLRLKPGDTFPAVDRDGKRFFLTIINTDFDSFTASYYEAPQVYDVDNPIQITLIQCLPKGKKLEGIVRQAVESGVSMIIPVESENSVAVIKEERSDKKTARLQKIAEEAVQQSGNRGVPIIHEPINFYDIPDVLREHKKDDLNIFFHQERLAKTSLHSYLKSAKTNVSILIGPEGGLSAKETAFLLDSGFISMYLGSNILRTETAAVFALGAVKTILLEKNEWKAVTHV